VTRVVVIGECMVELRARPDGAYDRAFAGDAYNVAVQLKRRAPDIQVQFATVTGDDGLSADMRRAWRAVGIDDTLSPAIPGLLPGLYAIETDAAGERRFSYWRGQSAARRWLAELDPARLAGADLLFLTGVSLAILSPGERAGALAFIDRLGARALAFDPNIRPALWENEAAMRATIEGAMDRASILLPSADDLERLWGAGTPDAHLRRCQSFGAREVALTLGAEGCLVAEAGSAAVRLSAPATKVMDTSGAGDAFDGAYLAARLAGASAADAARAGLALAAHVVSLAGALPREPA
jgi:2-dehydro-3-deoxygluconokinase